MAEADFDFVIINSPVNGKTGKRFAIDSCRSRSTVVLFLAPAADYADLTPDLKKRGVFVIRKPVAKQTILQVIDWMETSRERLRDMEKKNLSVEEKMKEIRIVNRAKLLLISELGMNEDEAHHYIEKNSMDNGITKLDVANSVIRVYS
ncbi:MAG: ANTAR domain-containing protein [Eubacterium sp.]|nr:ANTAR domain-containing protein [Eubacterium sp.]